MTAPSAMIKDMKSMPWPLALVVTVTILVIGGLAMADKDINVVMNAILFLLMALGYAELREVKTNTNGNNTKLLEELAEYRRNQARMTDRAFDSQPAAPSHPPEQ